MTDFYVSLGRRIKYYRKLARMSLEEIGNQIGVGKSTVRKYEVADIKISHKRLEQIANALGIDVALLYGEEISGDVVDVPLYGSISCGNGSVIYEEKEEYITSPKHWVDTGVYFYLTAKGDSMTGAKIHEGDLLLIQQQETVENSEIAAVVVDNECVLKRVYKNDKDIMLISENPNYPPIRFDPKKDQNVKIIGKLRKAITQF
ncbi:LexA family protein [Virgibacillus ainsalahensis]